MLICTPFAKIVKTFLDMVEGEESFHCIEVGKKIVSVNDKCFEIVESCREPRQGVGWSYEVWGPSPIARMVRKVVKKVARARLRVYRDIRREIELLFLPFPESPWVSITLWEDRYLMKAHRSLDEFLQHLNEVGIHVPSNVFEIHDKLNLFENEFALFIASTIPRPVLVTEGRLVIHGGGKHHRIAIEATLSQNVVKERRLSVGKVYTLVVYP